MTRKLSEKKKAAKALAFPPIPRSIVKANHSLRARLAFFDYANQNNKPPKVVIIIPARDRNNEKIVVSSIYKNSSQLKVIFVNQNWDLPFNKGALLNIGYLEVKKIFPHAYQNITFVFHDVDVIPFPEISLQLLLDRFKTVHGTIKHLYGFQHSLGGVFSITGADYEKVGGFANLYGWHMEDVIFQDRAITQNLVIDRSIPYFVDIDHGGTTLNLSTHIPFNIEYRIYFLSEWERDIETDNISTLTSYAVQNEGSNIFVTAFTTAHSINVEASNIRVCSKVQLPARLMVKNTRKKNVHDGEWFINQWNADLHGDVVKVTEDVP